MRSVRFGACVTCSVLALSISGCSSATWLAAGPAARFEHDQPPRIGGEVLARDVIGDSDGKALFGFETSGRLLATSREQLLGIGVGPAWLGSFGRGLVTLEGTPMLGFEHVPGSVLTLGTLRGGIGFGYAFERTTSWHDLLWPDPSFVHELTKSTALTFELTGAVDAPVTRAPEYSVSVLIGVAWLEQWHAFRREEAPGYPGNGFGFPVMRPGTYP
jgi:hypothetical protein